MSEGLTGKLGDVRVGSVLQLQHPRISVCGYVVERGEEQVLLSYMDPNNPQNFTRTGHTYNLTRGDRRYQLAAFHDFTVLSEPGKRGARDLRKEGNFTPIVGDIILFDSEEGRAAGYLTGRKGDWIALSHRDPNSLTRGIEAKFFGFSPLFPLGDGDRTFTLTKFSTYDILNTVRGEESTLDAPGVVTVDR